MPRSLASQGGYRFALIRILPWLFDDSDFLLLLNPNLVIYIFLENFPKERIGHFENIDSVDAFFLKENKE